MSTKENWQICKEFGADYGHRVHNQRLNKEYSMDDDCVCKHLHGHRLKLVVYLEASELDGGFVTDFKHLNWVKNFIDGVIDHKFILDLNDPWFVNIINAKPIYDNDGKLTHLTSTLPLNTKCGHTVKVNTVYVPGTEHFAGYAVDASDMSGPEKEFFEGFFLVPFVPSSENLSKWVFECVDSKMSQINVKTTRIDWWETPKSKSTYRRIE